jgi:hypothetical protein
MAKVMKSYGKGGGSKCGAEGKAVKPYGGNQAKHDGVVSKGEKYPAANATGKGRPEAAKKTR